MRDKRVKISKETLKELYGMVFQLNKSKLRIRDGQSLLHLAVNGASPVDDFHTSDVCKFPCLDTVKLLLHCGASVEFLDRERNSPLHTLSSTFPAFRSNTNEMMTKAKEIAILLIEAGIHLDAINTDGFTASKASSLRKFSTVLEFNKTNL